MYWSGAQGVSGGGVVLVNPKGATAMARWNDEYQKAIENLHARRLSRQEQLLFDATELISRAMADEGISRSELAKRIGKSKAYVTQVLRANNNMTLRTLSDLADALGYVVELGAANSKSARHICVGHWNGPTKCDLVRSHYSLKNAVRALACESPSFEGHSAFERAA
jgi:transcriptional regulator with XRE-family HTH domain